MSTTNSRAKSSGVRLCEQEACVIKGMLARGDRQHDIASYFGVDSGRISEIATGQKFASAINAAPDQLPPSGPYAAALPVEFITEALDRAAQAIAAARSSLRR